MVEYLFESSDKFEIFESPKKWHYKPLNDITAYELALIVPVFSMTSFDQIIFLDKLPKECKRHFEISGEK